MRKVVGALLILVAVAFGIYIGFWVSFIGGGIQICEALKSGFVVKDFATGMLKLAICAPGSWMLTYVFFVIGKYFIE